MSGAALVQPNMAAAQVDLGDWPAVAAYIKRMSERPACAATIARATDMQMEAKK